MPPPSSQVLLHVLFMNPFSLPDVIKISSGTPEILCWQEWDRLEITVTLTFDHENLISSSLSPNGHLCTFWRNSSQSVYVIGGMWAHSDLDFWPPSSHSWDIAFTRMSRWTTQKHNAPCHALHLCRDIKTKAIMQLHSNWTSWKSFRVKIHLKVHYAFSQSEKSI